MGEASYVEYRSETLPPAESLPSCPVETCTRIVSNKWRPLILRDLLEGPLRFGELRRSVGPISGKVLTQNLRDLEEAGIVLRRVYPEVPPRVGYALTELGRTLGPIIWAMRDWGLDYQRLAAEKRA